MFLMFLLPSDWMKLCHGRLGLFLHSSISFIIAGAHISLLAGRVRGAKPESSGTFCLELHFLEDLQLLPVVAL